MLFNVCLGEADEGIFKSQLPGVPVCAVQGIGMYSNSAECI